ncbi:MAG: hypothetical protein NTY45_04530, partial [Elusimicrobia bacterium]|nr:hypothetical protein [Elusimicrobiota bacterium]
MIDYRAGPVLDQLRAATRDVGGRIDVYFDNVGGDHLDAALAMSTKEDPDDRETYASADVPRKGPPIRLEQVP